MKNCNQCGKCCIKYSNGGLIASEADIESWELFRPEIYRYVRDQKIWMDPISGEQIELCPWLEILPSDPAQTALKYGCKIYFDRPEDCRHYPSTIDEMVRDECEMLEVVDLKDHHVAQKKLDKLMIDSRPSQNH